MRRAVFPVVLLWLLIAGPVWAVQNVVSTRHNLSTSGPGTVKSLTIDAVCVFCHTPHDASPEAPLWNRQMSVGQTYSEYGSTTLKATPGQPTGSSRLCLACHDGTVALGAFVNPPTGPANDLQNTFLTGRGNLDTDLSDDHPISFVYDVTLQGLNPELADPTTIDLPLENEMIQCSTCHDPHEKDLAPFLKKTMANGELCTTCHERAGTSWDWATSSHATSTATPTGATPWPERRPEWRGATVAENSCMNCHTPHNAPMAERLIKAPEEEACYLCHNGTVAATDVQADSLKAFKHPVETTPNTDHDAEVNEDPLTMTFHVECMDCHQPHGVQDAPPMITFHPNNPSDPDHMTPPAANIRIKGVQGLDINGFVKADVDFQYELCFKCHGLPGKSACDNGRCPSAGTRNMVRVDGVYNIRDKFDDTNPALQSYHPVVTNDPGNNADGVPSLRTDTPMNTTTALIYCTDCHSGDTSPAAGGTGPNGPHGSNWEGLLAQQYTFNTDPANSTEFYDLCYKCHVEADLRNNLSGFNHNGHIGARGGACILCHDPHGSQATDRLINFLVESDGIFVVDCVRTRIDDPVEGRIDVCTDDPRVDPPITDPAGPIWIDDLVNPNQGECWLVCHGSEHSPKSY